jgi:predicted ATP-grasp superfamily ATP-dependent carboligase
MAEPLHLLILGASVRAAACSAMRAGLRPWGADSFGDTDLPAGCRFQRVGDYPDGLLRVAVDGPPGPWMYTGALENRPDLVERISRNRPLWGNSAAALRDIRTPERVFQILAAAGIPCPAVCDGGSPPDGRHWLLKPRAGAGGRGIKRRSGRSLCSSKDHYFQEFIEGEPCAALYLGVNDRAVFIGATRQLVGRDWLHAKGFQYCGSVGPLPLAPGTRKGFQHLGEARTAGFHLQGLFGVDSIIRDDVPFPVEVNPRYTASVEILELAGGIRALDMHRQACVAAAGFTSPVHGEHREVVGKAILCARVALRFPKQGPWLAARSTTDGWAVPPFADIPAPGTPIGRGKPILTLFCRGGSVEECEARLRMISCDLDRVLFGP